MSQIAMKHSVSIISGRWVVEGRASGFKITRIEKWKQSAESDH